MDNKRNIPRQKNSNNFTDTRDGWTALEYGIKDGGVGLKIIGVSVGAHREVVRCIFDASWRRIFIDTAGSGDGSAGVVGRFDDGTVTCVRMNCALLDSSNLLGWRFKLAGPFMNWGSPGFDPWSDLSFPSHTNATGVSDWFDAYLAPGTSFSRRCTQI